MGKNPENTMQLTGVSHLLRHFIDEVKQNISLIDYEKIDPFVLVFERRFDMNLTNSKQKIQNNIKEMGDWGSMDGQEIMIYYTILTKLLEAIREYSYNSYGLLKIKETWKKQTGKHFSGKPKAALQKMAALNKPDVSILYNLSFIAHLAQAYQDSRLIPTTKRLITLRVNRIVRELNLG